MKHDAIVILGFSGAGKDTTFAALNSAHPGRFTNVKFGALAKQLTANALGISLSVTEDKELRKLPSNYGISAFDLLTVLFQGCNESLTEAHIRYALDNISHDKIPVFTDVRRSVEAYAICREFRNPLFLWLMTTHAISDVNDKEIMSIVHNFCTHIIHRLDTPESTVKTIEAILNGEH